MPLPRICLLGLDNLSVLAPERANLPPAGEPVQQTLLARALVRRGFEVSMVVADLGQPDGAVFDGIRTLTAYKPDAGIPVLRFVHPRWTGIAAALARAEADVYYTSCASAALTQLAGAARRRGARAVFRVASDSDCDPSRLLIRLWRDRKLYEHGLARMDSILVQSEHQRDTLRRNYGHASEVAGMFVAPPEALLPFDARATHALWVSNIRHVKRPDVLLDLAKALPEVAFRMVGGPLPGAEAEFDRARDTAAQLPNVLFSGALPYAATGGAYAAARVLVNTSDVEGFPNSYLQAWSHGVPVVAFFDPDGVIRRHGLGIAADSPAAMREAVLALTRDRGAWQQASQRCLDYMAAEFGEDRVLEPYLRAFGMAPQATRQAS